MCDPGFFSGIESKDLAFFLQFLYSVSVYMIWLFFTFFYHFTYLFNVWFALFSSLLSKKKLHKYELASIANLCPETAEEAKSLIPRLMQLVKSSSADASIKSS